MVERRLAQRGRRPLWMTHFGEEPWGDIWSDRLSPGWISRATGAEERWSPDIDFYQEGGNYHLTVDLPGIKKEDISIEIDGDVVTVSGKKESRKESKEENYYLRESRYGSFSRSLRVPNEVDEDSVEATYKDGVLNISMKPQKEPQRKKVEIKS